MPRHALCGCFTWNTRLLQNKQGNSKKKNDISSENDISSLAGRDLWCGAFYVDVSRETQGCYRISRKTARKEWYEQTKTTQANWLGEAYDAARFMWMFHVKHKTLEGWARKRRGKNGTSQQHKQIGRMWFIDMARFTWNTRLLQDKQENSEKRMT